MDKVIVSEVEIGGETRSIEKITSMGVESFKIKTPSGMYVGKTKNGGYTTLNAAVKAAVRML